MVASAFLIPLMWLLLFQEEKPPPPPPVDPEPLLAQARQTYLRGEFSETIDILKPAVRINHGLSMLLSADAYYALQTPESFKKARFLYERSIYEDDTIPFADHSYYRLAQIYIANAAEADDKGRAYDATTYREEAGFFLTQMLKKYPDSYFRDQALNSVYEVARDMRRYRQFKSAAELIWARSTDLDLLIRAEPVMFIEQRPPPRDVAALTDTYTRHADTIHLFPELMFAYADRFEALNDLAKAGELYLDIINLWPQREDSPTSLLRLAEINRRQGFYEAAGFLCRYIVEAYPNSDEAELALLAGLEMMDRRQIRDFVTPSHQWTYAELLEAVRHSGLDDPIRARYSYQLAVMEAMFGNLEKGLLIMANLVAEYQRGPFSGLYRNAYQNLLFQTIDDYHAAGNYWGLDRIYNKHRPLLAFTTEVRYPEKIADAYLKLNLPSSALLVYDNMWNFKQSITGFELAFEPALTEYLKLLDIMRMDEKLTLRMAEYADIYSERDRFYPQYQFVEMELNARRVDGETLLEPYTEEPFVIGNIWDARRLRRLALVAQEEEKKNLADRLYATARRRPSLREDLPILLREAELYYADRLFELADYNGARDQYERILVDQQYDASDRDWAYLQIARLFELEGKRKQSLRIYGQIAWSPDADSVPYSLFAKRRLDSLAANKTINQMEKELEGGQF
ncbi:tetratricopeptide repeat protein [Acanthopleuribacter pedis]|uniref:Tetratricopeptide repeat protein n=1 Tax=Acanthopleuribacter pedis TaxID=442870 RepID=A0A8J7U8K9_9BACT|nr:hypothetical protein [Acanthopleuribacter pedis]MBO1322671.1 hypothetical protein [Acanthopleuribacter pedis]